MGGVSFGKPGIHFEKERGRCVTWPRGTSDPPRAVSQRDSESDAIKVKCKHSDSMRCRAVIGFDNDS